MALELKFPLTKSPKPPYDITSEDNIIKSVTVDGYELVRPRYTKVRRVIKLKWDITNTEYLTLDTFYNTTVKNGAIPFNLVFKTIGAGSEDSGINFSFDVRFAERPKFSYVGIGVWEAEFVFREV